MTLATVAAPNGNGLAVLFVMVILIGFITVVVLWMHERMWDAHERELAANAEQLARLDYWLDSLLEFLGVEVPEPIEDDSPEAEEAAGDADAPGEPNAQVNHEEHPGDDTPTLPGIPAIPATEPSGIPIQVHGALIEATHELMTPETAERQRVARAAFVEEQLARFDFTGRRK